MFKSLRYILFSLLVLAAMLGFSQTPTIASFSPESGPAGTLVTINGTNLSTPTVFTIGGQTAIVISNTGSVLVGMVMPNAVTGTVSITTAGGTATGNSSFIVTATNYPSAQQGSKLVGTGGIPNSNQGQSVALSADGNTAIVGGYADNNGVGAVWFYTRSGGAWLQQGSKQVVTDGIGTGTPELGYSVSLSADGNTAIAGGIENNGLQVAAWVFTRSGNTWTQQGSSLMANDNMADGNAGAAVSISADGNTVILGDWSDTGFQGAAWVYTRSGGAWTQQGTKLVGTGSVGQADQGFSVALSADGNTAIVCGTGDHAGVGAAWVYTRTAGVWTQQGSKLVGNDVIGAAQQGYYASLSADGNTAIVGGLEDNSLIGAAWVYTRSGGTWSQQGPKLVATDATTRAEQGVSVSLSADGNTAIVGGLGDNSSLGAAWVYTRSGGAWTQQGSKLVGTGNAGTSILQGNAVSISADGSTAMVGGVGDNSFVGAAWVYVVGPPVITSFSPATGPAGTLVTINGTNLNIPTAVNIGGQSAIVVSNTSSTLVAMVIPGTITGTVSIITTGGTSSGGGNFTVTQTKFPSAQQGSKLVGTGSVGANVFQGSSVSVSADGNTAIVGATGDNTRVGAAWIYTRSGGAWTQQGSKLVGTGSVGTPIDQGTSVALSADGNTAIVGGVFDNSNQGAVWIYTRSGGTWSQQGPKLVGTGGVGQVVQGASVSLSADGNTAMVGGSGDNPVGGGAIGAVWVYTRKDGTWTQQGTKLVGTGSTGDFVGQGRSVSLSADGNTAIVGGPEDNNNLGAVWVYTRIGEAWGQQGTKLVGTGGSSDGGQGWAVSLSADGNTALIGAANDNARVGAAWVFIRSGGTWTQQGAKLVGTGVSGAALQGTSVSLSADGNTAIIGGNTDNSSQGAGWVYTRSGSTWTQQGTKLVGTGNTGAAQQGISVSMSADGSTAFVGWDEDNSNEGAAWVFTPSTNASLSTIALTPASTLTNTGTSGSITTFTTSVNSAIASVTVTPTTNVPTSTVTVNGTAVISGTASASIPLAVGTNIITTVVTAQDGITTKTYSITVTRAPSNNASLSSISLTPYSTLTNTGTSGTTTTYTASVSNTTTSVTITPTTSDPNAQVTVNGIPVFSGTASGPVALAAAGASTTINTVVTAQDGVTTRTYSIIVTRMPSANASLSTLALSPYSTLTNTGTVGTTTTYTASVGNATPSLTVTPSTADPTATVKVNGTSVASGTASGAIALAAGTTTNINIVVTAQNGTTTRTYSITVTRAGPNIADLSNLAVNTGALSPVFASGTISYTATATNATTSIAVTPTAIDPKATIKVNGIAVTSGKASGPIALGAEGTATVINTVVTSQDGTLTKTYSITVTRAPSANASLTTIALTPYSTLVNTSTVGSVTTYTTSVSSATASVKVTPTTGDPNATVKVNGIAVTSGTASASIALAAGQNTINTIVTAQNGTTTKTYSIIVTRADPTNANLANLVISSGTLTPAFAPGTASYTAAVSNATASITVTPTMSDPNAKIKVNGVAVTPGTASGAITLAEGTITTINTVVTAEDGKTTKTYSVVVTRAPSSNASLSAIVLTPYSTLTNTGTTGTTTTYTTSVSNATTSVKVTPTTADPNAAVKVNGTAVTSGTASGSIALAVGANTITIVVTAQDGTTTRTYVIALARAPGPLMSLYHPPVQPIIVTEPTNMVTIENDGVMVRQGLSPNGDGINDVLTIDGITAYPDNHFTIVDRNGSLIFQAKGYDNSVKAFDGHSSVNGRVLQTGTYFYSLDYIADGQTKHKTGYIILKY